MSHRPSVLFVCLKNNGRSQLAARLFRKITCDAVDVSSAGTRAGIRISGLFAAALLDLGIDITGKQPRQLTYRMNRAAGRVVVLGRNVQVQPVAGTPIEVWDIDEPSRRGIGGIERVRLIHADITDRVNELAQRLQPDRRPRPGTRRPTPQLSAAKATAYPEAAARMPAVMPPATFATANQRARSCSSRTVS